MQRVEIRPQELHLNLFSGELLRGALLCAGDMEKSNCMTISWATMGVLWNKNVFVVYVRPTRHTFSFIEKAGNFTVNFFGSKYRDILAYCGTHSGRDVDKFKECNLTLINSNNVESPCIDESHLIIECETIYSQDIQPDLFVDRNLEKIYPKKDYHRLYIGHILGIYGVSRFIDQTYD